MLPSPRKPWREKAFNHQVDLNGNTITKSGAGTLAFNNNLSTGTGGTVNCEEGSCIGTGTINGNLFNGGTVSPGNASAVSAVPEPSTLLLLTSGMVLLFSSRHSRR